MRFAALLLALAASPALAAGPNDYRARATITLTGSDPLQRVVLPFEVYRDARRDLADVRVFNARGEPVPIALAGEPDAAKEVPAPVPLPLFPVTSITPRRGTSDVEVTVRTQDGSLVTVRSRTQGSAPAPVAFLADASQLKEPVGALIFDWQAAPGTEVVNLRLEASDDLASWSGIASSAPLVKLKHGGRALSQPRVEFASRRARYYRITWGPGEFGLRSVLAEPEAHMKQAPRPVRSVNGAPSAKPGELVFDLGARLPVEAVRIVPAEGNSVVSVAVLAKEDENSEWRAVASGAFYRLTRAGAELQSPPLEIGRRPARYWMARLDSASAGGAPPVLEAQWRDAQLVMVAHGEAPFTLAFGKSDDKPAWLPVASLIPGYERLAESRLPQARLGDVSGEPRPDSAWQRWVDTATPLRIILWGILLGAVGLMGFVAWRIFRQMPPPVPPGPR
ncbi:MAG: DUF3999 domain-containing protein [Usitatibacter sp.]